MALHVKSDTIERYLKAAASFATPLLLPDPRYDQFGARSHFLEKVMREYKRWEAMPNRREPVTIPMIQYMYQHRGNIDSITHALYDWNVIGHYLGLRLSEWAQVKPDSHIPMAPDGLPFAFTFHDMVFFSHDKSRIVQRFNIALRNLRYIATVQFRWRYQKNGDNGQLIDLARDLNRSWMCPVLAAIRIRERARKYNDTPNCPLAIAVKRKHCQLIYKFDIDHILQKTAKAVYSLTDPNDIKKFTTHSIRVGAAVSLHSAGKSGSYIKIRLRWRSDTFLLYLRNTTTLALQHVAAINSVH